MFKRAIATRKEELAFMRSQLALDLERMKDEVERELITREEELPTLRKQWREAPAEWKKEFELRVLHRERDVIPILKMRLGAIPSRDETQRRIKLVEDNIKQLEIAAKVREQIEEVMG